MELHRVLPKSLFGFNEIGLAVIILFFVIYPEYLTSGAILFFGILLLGTWIYQTWIQRKDYPPGPFPLPVIGNIAQVCLLTFCMNAWGGNQTANDKAEIKKTIKIQTNF